MKLTIKIPKSAKRDFAFLTGSDLHGIGVGVGCETLMGTNGYTALEAWVMLDTHGKRVPCREPELLDAAISGKASWNLQIKQWAEDLADGFLLKTAELAEYCRDLNCPPWVEKATVNQAKRIAIEEIGFVPTFLRLSVEELKREQDKYLKAV